MKRILLLVIALLCPLATWAQDIKPFDAKLGLWESTSTTVMGGMPARPAMPALTPDQLAQIPPAQRAQMEAMMKGGPGAPRTSTTRFCLAKDSLSKAFYNADKSCTAKLVNSTNSMQQIHVECNGVMKAGGDLKMERVDAEHMKGSMAMKATGDERTGGAGQSLDIKVTFSNKWVSADCGDVKPVGTTNDK